MPLIHVTLIEKVFSETQKEQIVRDLTDTTVSILGEDMRAVTHVWIEEIEGQEWAVGGGHEQTGGIHYSVLFESQGPFQFTEQERGATCGEQSYFPWFC